MILAVVVAGLVCCWLAYWMIRVGLFLLMFMLAAVFAVGYAMIVALAQLPRVAQWIERRLSGAEVARSTRAARSYSFIDEEGRTWWIDEAACLPDVVYWPCCGAPLSGGHRGTCPRSLMRSGQMTSYQRQGASGSTRTPLDGGNYA